MDLQRFVKETLTEIALGVNAAQDQAEVELSGARINPPGIPPVAAPDGYLGQLASGEVVCVVDFDLAVTVSGSGPNESSSKIEVLGLLTAKLNGAKRTPRDSISRIKFKVPIAFRADPGLVSSSDTKSREQEDAVERWSRTEP